VGAKALHDRLLAGRREQRACLLVLPDNVAARSAYEAWGWYKIGDLRPFDDAPVYDAMLRDLRPPLDRKLPSQVIPSPLRRFPCRTGGGASGSLGMLRSTETSHDGTEGAGAMTSGAAHIPLTPAVPTTTSVRDLARLQGVRPIVSADELAMSTDFDIDAEYDEFIADLYESRQASVA
jgi:hypothetical protein